jgi:hypothetical protein
MAALLDVVEASRSPRALHILLMNSPFVALAERSDADGRP